MYKWTVTLPLVGKNGDNPLFPNSSTDLFIKYFLILLKEIK